MKKYVIIASALLLIGGFACQKEDASLVKDVVEANETTNNRSLESYYEDNIEDNTQTFIVDANAPISITGKEGSVLTIPANNFLDASGNLVQGNVEIQLIEIFEKADMLRMDMTTLAADGDMLISAGEFFINATLPGSDESLRLIDMMTLNVSNENPNPDMKLWKNTGNGWELFESDDRAPDGLLEPYDAGYVASIPQFGWINFDVQGLPMCHVDVIVPTGSDPNFTDVFISLDGMNAMIHVPDAQYNGVDTYHADAPENHFVSVVVIQMDPNTGLNTYNIVYSTFVTCPLTTINLTPLLNGSIGGMDNDINTLP